MKESSIVMRVKEAYNEMIKTYDPRKDVNYMRMKEGTDYYLLGPVKDKLILDVGCFFPIDVIKYAHQGVNLMVGIDFSYDSLRFGSHIAKNELKELYEKVEFVCCDARALPFRRNIFDAIACFSTLDHIPGKENRLNVLKEIASVLKKGGVLAITVPNKLAFIAWFLSIFFQKGGLCRYGYEYFYFPWELKKEINDVGLKPVSFKSSKDGRLVNHFGVRIGFRCLKP